MVERVDLSGRRFQRLLVISESHKTLDRVWHWHCRCDCGVNLVVSGKNLKNGNSKSCGCVHGIAVDIPVTHEQLTRLLAYDPETGDFTWLVDGRRCTAGQIAGHRNLVNKYLRIWVGGCSYYGHILAWFYMTRRWSVEEIDHKDTDKTNNKWDNLREATRVQNTRNANCRFNNKSGFKGVSKKGNSFRAVIERDHLGMFTTAQEAAAAYDLEAIKRFGKFARTNFGVD